MVTPVLSPPLAPALAIRQAGGGMPSAPAPARRLLTFSGALLRYLGNVAHGSRTLPTAQLAELPAGVKKFQPKSSSKVADQAKGVLGLKDFLNQDRLDLKGFLEYMASPASNAEGPLEGNDLDWPIASYFVSSSHNTYLTGNQLYGEASTDAYKNVLLRGCRCIEIDVWDGKEAVEKNVPDPPDMTTPLIGPSRGPRAEPRVFHGYTLTKEVSFRDVCETIGEYAFVHSDLPLIVSLEVHTSPEQQEVMVEIMEGTWGDMLVEVLKGECKALPSPDQLRGKILVKVKGAPFQSPKELGTRKAESGAESDEEEPPSPKPSKIVSSLSALGVYTRSYHYKGLTEPEAQLPNHVFSLPEKKVLAVHESDGPTLFSHNRHYLMRAYPCATRITSSNLDPTFFWRKGIQMVALNWQRIDEGVQLNEGMFSGTPGWVLKPAGFRGRSSDAQGITKESQADAIRHWNLNLTIEVLALQDLPKARHPYVLCELHMETSQERVGARIESGGRSHDGEMRRRSKTSDNLDGDFTGEMLQFADVSGVVPELSFLRFKLMNNVIGPDEFVAWSCIRLDRLREGYRLVQFLDPKGLESSAVLLVKITKELT